MLVSRPCPSRTGLAKTVEVVIEGINVSDHVIYFVVQGRSADDFRPLAKYLGEHDAVFRKGVRDTGHDDRVGCRCGVGCIHKARTL